MSQAETNGQNFNQPGLAKEKAIQLLRELGLTGTEAEVYFAALQACTEEPVSSYKLAQAMGRDPANVAKTLGGLVHLQAVTVVQDKPRLFLPTDPADFADTVVNRLRHQSQQAVALLEQFRTPEPEGVTLGLPTAEQAFAKARALLAGCRHRAIVFGSKESLREVGGDLEAIADSPGRSVQILSPVPMVSETVSITVYQLPQGHTRLEGREFLQLVVDGTDWLCADLSAENGVAPCGWWGKNSPLAAVMAGPLALAWQDDAVPAATSFEEPATSPSEPTPAPETPAPELPTAPPPESSVPEKEVIAEEPEEVAEELTFLMRHDDPKAPKKGEL